MSTPEIMGLAAGGCVLSLLANSDAVGLLGVIAYVLLRRSK
jgi:hypothetical protein